MRRLLPVLRFAIPFGALALLVALPIQAQGNCSDGSTGIIVSVSRAEISPDGSQFEICFAVEGDPDDTLRELQVAGYYNGSGLEPDAGFTPAESPFEAAGYVASFAWCLGGPDLCPEYALRLERPGGEPPFLHLPSEPTEFVCTTYDIRDPSESAGIEPYFVYAEQGDGSPASVCPLEDQAMYDGPLPVELASFEAVTDGRDVLLRWTTASETNNAGFEVEHRAPDAPFFEPVGHVEGHGTTTEAQTYRHRVDDLWPGTHAFRLKQVDFDGQFEYSAEVEAEVAVPGAVLARVYPSPANPQATFTFMSGEDQFIVAEVFDMRGRRTAQPFRQTAVAQQTYTLAVGAGLPSGVYVLRLLGDRMERPLTSRFVIAR